MTKSRVIPTILAVILGGVSAAALVVGGWALTRGPATPPAPPPYEPRAIAVDFAIGSDVVARAVSFPPEDGTVLFFVTRVIDGDTVEGGLLVKQHVRLRGINSPEIRIEGVPEPARDRLTALCNSKLCVMALYGRDKYGRMLADIYPPEVGGKTASQILLAEGLAKPYSGKGPKP